MDTVETAQYSVFRDSLAYCLYFEILSISALFIVLVLPILDISGCRYWFIPSIWRFDTGYTGQYYVLGTWILLKLLNTPYFEILWRIVYTLRYSVFRPSSKCLHCPYSILVGVDTASYPVFGDSILDILDNTQYWVHVYCWNCLILRISIFVGILFILWDTQYFGPLHTAFTAHTRY